MNFFSFLIVFILFLEREYITSRRRSRAHRRLLVEASVRPGESTPRDSLRGVVGAYVLPIHVRGDVTRADANREEIDIRIRFLLPGGKHVFR